MKLPNGKSQFDIIEVRFKSSRKSFFRNLKGLSLSVGDVIVVEGSPGYDVGVVSIVGELARIQLQKKAPNFKVHEARQVLRIASQEDIDKWVTARKREDETMHQAREMALRHNLAMKISDVEFQGDGSKATFYYTAETRIDFRLLIKDMADAFRVRIEMRQIGARQESARLGGIGSCGRELCCTTWLTDFRSVSTSAARYQQLSLNPQKLAGQCGKLKCCLNFELDMYMDALKDFPSTEIRLKTEKGIGIHIKTDVFKELMWYLHQTDAPSGPTLIALSPNRVKEIIALNKEGKKPSDLKDFDEVKLKTPDYSNAVDQDDLNRFDKNFKKKKKRKNNNRKKPQNKQTTAPSKNPPKSKTTEKKTQPPKNKPKRDTDKPIANKKRRRPPRKKYGGKNNPNNSNEKKDQ
jgi:cell fate regulator YaaT (PSP1 superfamily)